MKKKGITPILYLTFLLCLVFNIVWTKDAYASGDDRSTAEKVQLDTWYVDRVGYGESAWFQFTTSNKQGSKYLIYSVPFEADSRYGRDTAEGDYHYETSTILTSPAPRAVRGKDVNGRFLKLEAGTSYRFRIDGHIYNEDMFDKGIESSLYCIHYKGQLRYKFIIVEIPSSAVSIQASSDYRTPTAVSANKWYKVTCKQDITKAHITRNQFFTFKSPDRRNSKYAVLALPEADDVYSSTCIKSNGKYTEDNENLFSQDEACKVYPETPLYFDLLNADSSIAFRNSYIWYGDENDYLEMDKSDFFYYKFFILEMPDLPSKQVIRTLKAGTKSFTVTFNKNSLRSRYQIAYKLSSSSTWKFTSTTSTSKTIKYLTKGKQYEVKVRTQRKINGKYHCGQWSTTKSIRV